MRPQSVTAQGLFEVLDGGLRGIGIEEFWAEQCKKLVGVGTDSSKRTERCG